MTTKHEETSYHINEMNHTGHALIIEQINAIVAAFVLAVVSLGFVMEWLSGTSNY